MLLVNTKKYKIYDKCPLCNNKLEAIKDEKNNVLGFFCNNCGIDLDIEDLEYEEVDIIEGKFEKQNIKKMISKR